MSSAIKETLANCLYLFICSIKFCVIQEITNSRGWHPQCECEMEQVPTIHFLKQMWRRDDAMPKGSLIRGRRCADVIVLRLFIPLTGYSLNIAHAVIASVLLALAGPDTNRT